jgi:hypothetical protein
MQLRRTLIVVLALLGALAMPVRADAVSGITAVGTLERFPQEAVDAFGPDFMDTSSPFTQMIGGTLLPVPGAQQLWQVYPHREAAPQTGILVRDADSRQVIHSFVIPDALDRATVTFGGEWLHATDGGRRVFLVSAGQQFLYEVDAAAFTVRRRPLGVVPQLPNVVLSIGGITYDSTTGNLLVLYGGPAAFSIANRLTVLQRIDLTTGATQSRVVRACTGPLPATDIGGTLAAELLLRSDAVYVTCQTRLHGFPGEPFVESDTRAVVVRLPRATLWNADGVESSVDAGRRFGNALVDPAGGRIAVVDWFGRVTVVDIGSMSVAGGFDVANSNEAFDVGIGLNTTSGRLFFQSDLGFGYVDIRPTPLPSPVVDATAAGDGQERILPDPRTNRVYDLPGTALFPNSKADRYTIYNVAP